MRAYALLQVVRPKGVSYLKVLRGIPLLWLLKGVKRGFHFHLTVLTTISGSFSGSLNVSTTQSLTLSISFT